MSKEYVGIKQAVKKGYIECEIGGCADFSYPDSLLRRGRVQGGGGISPTLMSGTPNICKIERNDMETENDTEYRIRRLTPKECFRLQAFTDEEFDKAKYEPKTLYLIGEDTFQNTKLKAVKERPSQDYSETYVLCPINHYVNIATETTEMTELFNDIESKDTEDVGFAIEKLKRLEHGECSASVVGYEKFMANPLILPDMLNKFKTACIELKCPGCEDSTGYLKITLGENPGQQNLVTISLSIKLIIQWKIYLNINSKADIKGRIASIEDYSKNFSLMKLSDLTLDYVSERLSNTQLYKTAGNSITVNVLYYIYVELYKAMPYLFDDLKLGSFFSGIGAFESALDRFYGDLNAENFT